MENSKAVANETKSSSLNPNEENPNNNNNVNINTVDLSAEGGGESNAGAEATSGIEDGRQSRTPFTNLSQVDADLALARTLQEQERAFMLIRMNDDASDYGSWEAGSWEAGSFVLENDDGDFDDLNEDEYDDSDADDDNEQDEDGYDDEEDAFDVHAHSIDGDADDNTVLELDPADFANDEAFARALQDAEDREMAARLLSLSGINEVVGEAEDAEEDHGGNSQDTWEDVDPDELSYEELIALGDVVGTENRGLSADSIASLPSMSYKLQNSQDGNTESCVICRLDYEDGDTLTVLSCKHSYHSECINNWLRINKVCPICSAEVSTSGNS